MLRARSIAVQGTRELVRSRVNGRRGGEATIACRIVRSNGARGCYAASVGGDVVGEGNTGLVHRGGVGAHRYLHSERETERDRVDPKDVHVNMMHPAREVSVAAVWFVCI